MGSGEPKVSKDEGGLPAAPTAPPPLLGGSRLSSPLLGAGSFVDHSAAPRSAGEWIRKGLYSSGR